MPHKILLNFARKINNWFTQQKFDVWKWDGAANEGGVVSKLSIPNHTEICCIVIFHF